MKNVLLIAIACHSINVAYCAAMGDHSHKPWAETPKAIQDGTQQGVKLALANPDHTPEDMHNAWAAAKLAAGWTHGEVKDNDAKTHPNLVPYNQLPIEQQAKDCIFIATVRALAAMPEPGTEAQPTKEGETAVKYIGRAEEFTDHLYGTKLVFKTEQTRNLPDAIALQFLRHGDLFERGPKVLAEDKDTAAELAKTLAAKQALDQHQFELQSMRDTINALPTKDAIIEFAQATYQQTLDAKMLKDDLRQAALAFVDLYGTGRGA